MHILLIFLDGIGLGENDSSINPFAAINAPTLHTLVGHQRWLRNTPRTETAQAIFIPTDPRLGVAGRPQSATGQAAIMTGRNVPAEIGEHYGPKPTPAIRQIIGESSLYKRLTAKGKRGALLDAYPPRFFQSIDGSKRLRSSIQEAVYVGDVPIFGVEELYSGEALSADWTGQGWRDLLGYPDAPVFTPTEAGRKMAELARRYDFSLFSTWITDEIGHRGPLERGVEYLELFDSVMAGLLDTWDDDNGLIIITSDHGNLEDLSIRQHTLNDVPTVVIGAARHIFADGFTALTDITPKVLSLLEAE